MSDTPKTEYNEFDLFEHMSREHGLTLTGSELHEIRVAAGLIELEIENARQQMELDASCNAEELRQVRAENARLREELDDWHNAALHVEADHPDEVHCGCVPILRRENARLREEIKKLSQTETERMGGIE
jgi:hypothetical protein